MIHFPVSCVAKRGLQEETSFIAKTWTKIGSVYANPARQTNSIHILEAELKALKDKEDRVARIRARVKR
jgi:hypothetical protein